MTPAGIEAVLLDIEGTTTPIAFVYQTLFPYARTHVADYLARHQEDPACRAAVALLGDEYGKEMPDAGRPSGGKPDASVPTIVAYVESLMDQDRKSRGLKTLQGLIWEEGYRSGELRGQVFPDVKPALERWRAAGMRISIYSSGSVLAQQLLFQSTNAGDLTPLIDGYFDTTVGPKQSAESYRTIVAQLDVSPAQVLFVSDIERELDAAREAGLTTALCIRTGSASAEGSHVVIQTFDDL